MNELPDFLRSMPNFEYDLEESEDRNKKPRDPRLKWSSHKRVSRMDAVRERDAIGNASTLKSIVAIAKNGHTTTISTLWRRTTSDESSTTPAFLQGDQTWTLLCFMTTHLYFGEFTVTFQTSFGP